MSSIPPRCRSYSDGEEPSVDEGGEDAKQAAALVTLGKLLDEKEDYTGAEESYLQALEIDPQFADAHYSLGVLLEDKLHDYDGAEESYCRAIEADPNHAKAHGAFGVLLYDGGDYEGAESSYRHAIEIDPNYAKAHDALGVLLQEKRQDYSGAEESYNRAVVADPTDAHALFNLGFLLTKHLHKPGEGLALIKCAVALEDPDAQASLLWFEARSLEMEGNYDAAEVALRAYIEAEPDDSDGHADLAKLLKLKTNNEPEPSIVTSSLSFSSTSTSPTSSPEAPPSPQTGSPCSPPCPPSFDSMQQTPTPTPTAVTVDTDVPLIIDMPLLSISPRPSPCLVHANGQSPTAGLDSVVERSISPQQ